MVCRDSNGSIIAAQSQEECLGQSLWAESKAALLAASLAHKDGFARVVLEGDAHSVIKAIINPSTTPHWSINAIIEDTRVILNSFVCWNASFVFRDSNFVAHSLAQWAYFCNSFRTPPLLCSFWVCGRRGRLNLSPSLASVCFPSLFFVLIYSLTQPKKKEKREFYTL